MKKLFLILLCSLSLFTFSQKFGYVDSEKILESIPDYKKAQQEIDKLSIQYQKEIEEEYAVLDSLYQSFRKEEILLTDDMKRKRQNAIMEKEKEIKAYQKKIFGFEGLIFLKRQELIAPIQEKVFEEVKKIAETHKLQFVFDKAGDLVMLYVNPTHDYTDLVLEELGLGDPTDTIDNNK